MHELCGRSAVDLAALLAERAVSCVEVMDAHLAQIDELNPRLNAIVSLIPERARATAAQFDAKPPGAGATPPLWGLPIAHKDLVLTRGIRTTFGSPLYANNIPDQDDLIVERVRDAGAIAIGKTNVPEFGAGSQTFNRVFGATRNPYDPTRTCGGSSGGAAAALAARMLPLADGSDLGGSIRNPSSFCNVVGLRPTPGRVPAYPTLNPWFDMAVQGPMARSVDDVGLFLSVLVGADPRVPLALTDPGFVFYPVVPLDLRGVRIGLTCDFGLPVQPEIKRGIEASGRLLQSLGATVELACPDLSTAGEIFHVLRANAFRERFGSLPAASRAELKDTIRWNLAVGEALTAADLDRAWAARRTLFDQVAGFFRRYDFLVGPTTQVVPFDVSQPFPTEIDGVAMRDYLDWMQSCARITVTCCPALSLPAGFSNDGLPIGMQIVAPVRAERRLLGFAKTVEAATGYAATPPRSPAHASGHAAMKDLCVELERTWHEEIPISKAMGIQVIDFANDQLVVRAGLAPNINVHGTAFAGSLYAIAALCGWGMTWLQLKTRRIGGSIVIADGRIHYERPVKEPIVATCVFSTTDQAEALARLAADGKTRFILDCVIRANGANAARFTGDYAVRADRSD